MKVRVSSVYIGYMATVGQGRGHVEGDGREVVFAGDHRPMREIGEAISHGKTVIVDVEEWQILSLDGRSAVVSAQVEA